MGRRQTKQRFISSVELRLRAGLLTPKQAETFRLLFARCQTDADFEQVRKALEQVSMGVKGGTDRYALLLKDHELDP